MVTGLLLCSINSMANDCVIQTKSSSQATAQVESVSRYKSFVTKEAESKKCTVSFYGLVAGDWHLTHGEFIWDDARSENEGCQVAYERARFALTKQINASTVNAESVVICREDQKKGPVLPAIVGQPVNVLSMRPHPKFTKVFSYNGTQCRWFIESHYANNDIVATNGIACKLTNQWIVVDKF